jgi:hypothetical protein
MHVNSRGGELTDNSEDANTLFNFDDFCFDYIETLKLMGA